MEPMLAFPTSSNFKNWKAVGWASCEEWLGMAGGVEALQKEQKSTTSASFIPMTI